MNYWLKKIIQLASSVFVTFIVVYILHSNGVELRDEEGNIRFIWLWLICTLSVYATVGQILPKDFIEKNEDELKNQSKKIDDLKREQHISSNELEIKNLEQLFRDKLIDDDEFNDRMKRLLKK